jgi:DNA-binding response OmpR family regulator
MSKLHGREVLIVEDQPLILMDIAYALRQLGAKPTTASTLKQALKIVEHDNLAAAILDHGLPDGDSSILCEKLDARKVPFVIYTGHNQVSGACAKGALVGKPASTEKLIATVENMLPT